MRFSVTRLRSRSPAFKTVLLAKRHSGNTKSNSKPIDNVPKLQVVLASFPSNHCLIYEDVLTYEYDSWTQISGTRSLIPSRPFIAAGMASFISAYNTFHNLGISMNVMTKFFQNMNCGTLMRRLQIKWYVTGTLHMNQSWCNCGAALRRPSRARKTKDCSTASQQSFLS